MMMRDKNRSEFKASLFQGGYYGLRISWINSGCMFAVLNYPNVIILKR
jgi:hypothetical protein